MSAADARAVPPEAPMLFQIVHKTQFLYAGPANNNFNEVRLKPMDDELQSCRRFTLTTTPSSTPRDYTDFYGNCVYYFDVAEAHKSLLVEVASEVETVADTARKPIPKASLEAFSQSIDKDMFAEYLAETKYVPLSEPIQAESALALKDGRTDMWGDVQRIGEHVFKLFTFETNATAVTTNAAESLRLRRGVCQDYAHVMLGLCRAAGLPMRYVSGYFFNPQHNPKLPEASHAWVEAYIPEYGWAPFDPTHNRPGNQNYVKVATGRDYADIVPISGTYRGAPTLSMGVDVAVRELPARA